MANIAIVGKSGTGKSTSLGNFPELGIEGLVPKETVIVNVSGKDLPFKGWKKKYSGKVSEGGNYMESSNSDDIAKLIQYISEKKPEFKNIVIDDSQYLMSFEFMRRAKESGYGKYTDIGVNFAKVAEAARTTRKDLKVYFLWHPEEDSAGNMKMKTVGKIIDAYLTLEGLFTVILYTRVTTDPQDRAVYQFVTNNDGTYPAKSPYGMFTEKYIKNDLGAVSKAIDFYNEGE